jgi:hypothetical protein
VRRASAAVLAALALASCGSLREDELPPAESGAPAQVSVRTGSGLEAVLDTRARTLELRDGGRRVARASAGVGPTGLACQARGGWCWVLDTRGDALLVFDASGRDLELTRRLYLPGAPRDLAVDRARDRLRVTLTERDEIVELPAHGRPHVVARITAT